MEETKAFLIVVVGTIGTVVVAGLILSLVVTIIKKRKGASDE